MSPASLITAQQTSSGWRLAACCWAVAMAWGCLQDGGGATQSLWSLSLPHQDKLAHAGMHAVLAWLLWRGRSANAHPVRSAARIVVGCAIYGLAIEWGQWQFTLTRSAETLDALANTLGAMIGVAAGRWARAR